MRRRATLLALAGLVAAGVGACAHPPRPANMAPDGALVAAGSPLRNAIAVGTVSGGDKTNPLTFSRVGANEVREAVTLALRARGMLGADATSAPFRLDVGILEAGLPNDPYMTRVHCVMRYALRTRDGATVFDRVIEAVGEASVREVFYGVERLRVANERAVRANLAAGLDALVTAPLQQAAP